MKVICFKGVGNTGKTTVIRRILNEIFNIHLVQKAKDFSLILEYKGKKIGICSGGDNQTFMEKRLKPLKNANCDLIICACHPEGKTKTYEFIVREFGRENIEYINCAWKRKSSESEKDEENNNRFLKFKEKIERMLK